MTNKILKIIKAVHSFQNQVKLAQSSKIDQVYNLLKNKNYLELGIKAAQLSEREIKELMGYIGETGNEDVIEEETQIVIDAIEDAVEQGKVNNSAANNAIFFLNRDKDKALTPTNFLNELDEKSKPVSQQSPKPSSNQPPAQLSEKYYDALEDFEAFVAANASGFNANLRSKLSNKMEPFLASLEAYESNKKEMPIQTAQQWAAPILLIIASLIATGKQDNFIQANNLWMKITKASYGQVPSGVSAATWLTMRNNPYHQATKQDVKELANLGIKVELGEFILPVEQIKKNKQK